MKSANPADAAYAAAPVTMDHPSLNTPQVEYRAVHFHEDGTPYIADRYLNLSAAMQRYVLALTRIGTDAALGIAQRVANCCRTGHVSKRCNRGRFAVAHRHHCGDHFCATDSSGKYRFFKWAAKRDHAAFQEPHAGIEFKFREFPAHLTSHKQAMNALRGAAITLAHRLSGNTVSVTSFTERVADCAIRIVFPGTETPHTYAELKRVLEELGLENFVAVPKRGTTEELFWWAFAGFHDCAAMDADAKASLRVALIDYHCVATTGTLYRVLSKEEVEVADAADACLCPVCKDHDLETLATRQTQRTEEIEGEYEMVDWSREHLSPFVVRKRDLTYKSFEVGMASCIASDIAHSPPS